MPEFLELQILSNLLQTRRVTYMNIHTTYIHLLVEYFAKKVILHPFMVLNKKNQGEKPISMLLSRLFAFCLNFDLLLKSILIDIVLASF